VHPLARANRLSDHGRDAFFVVSIGLKIVISIAPTWTDLRPIRSLDECEMGVRAFVSNRASTLARVD
jgi:hypothetical protein